MKSNVRFLLVICVLAIGGLGLWSFQTLRQPATRGVLPELRAYPNLPNSFTAVLSSTRAAVRDPTRDAPQLRKLAQLYQANRLNQEARACYDLIARISPGLEPRDHYLLAQLMLDAGELTEAQAHLRSVVAQDPTYFPARLLLGDVLFKTGEEDAAAAEYNAILARDPQSALTAVALARLDLQRGQDELAIERLNKVVTAHPESASAIALLAQVLGRRGETERAAALTQQSRLLHDPIASDPWLDGLWSECYDKQRLALRFEEFFLAGQLDETLVLMKRLLEVDPESWIPPMLRGWSAARAGDVDGAVREYRLALAKGGDPERICPLLAVILAKRPAEAEAAMAEFYAKKPESIPILIAYADAAVRAADHETSLKLLRQLVEREPYLYKPNMDLARLLWSTPQREEAVACLRRIVKVFPVDIASRGLLAQHYLERADPAAAIPILEQALPTAKTPSVAREKLESMLHTALMQVGARAAETGRFAAAEENYERALALRPNEADTLAAAASVSAQLQHFTRAASALQKLATLQPSNPTIPLSLGDMLYQAGEKEAAHKQWVRAEELASAADAELRTAIEQRLRGQITAELFR